ncbi:GspH/FimT family pseudopilin [Pseudomonas sp. MBLB4136]|uniref:GspH/FimT family pseudopilin n=1 Tax=Pseudomonas sp. MBLB4136 TaxID=3451558 RepID=UPI003F74BF64
MRDTRGFTLIELMVTVAVLAIVISIAAPSFSAMLRDNRIATIGSELQTALQLARSEAIKRRLDVVVCRRNAAGTACENGTDWGAGWLIRQVGGDVLKVWDSVQDSSITGPNAGITFRGTGLAAAASNFSVTQSSCTGQQKRTLSVSVTGNTTLSKVNC